MSKLERRKQLGKWLKKMREDASLTQADLAKALGYDNAQIISNIERGVSAIPQKRIKDFAHHLKCEPMELDFRVLSSSVRDSGASKASDLALRYFPLLTAIDRADETKRDEIANYISRTLNLPKEKVSPSEI
jgi:transcriptional regulator with XRE-family HTH domain